jgi:hypothetical protein
MATATGLAPHTTTIRVPVANVGAATDLETPVIIAPYAGTVTSVKYIARTTITGANTDSRTVSLINKGAAGSGTAAPATLALTNGVNATAFVPKTITLSSTASDLDVAAGDVLSWKSLHVGATGLADVGGTIEVTIARA